MDPRRIDALIAEHVFGWEISTRTNKVWSDGRNNIDEGYLEFEGLRGCPPDKTVDRPIRHYSTDLDAAWEVVEKLEDYDPVILQCGVPDTPKGWLWSCDFEGTSAEHENVATAICLAALKAKGIEIDEYTVE